ncbi:hypothetical protein HGM15179_013537 [Zosterops borbonicus]|uniref:Uncharacterized protein n=1 Tax=Zosterops borbonicus TaxID=364589 RepID=A0A8K1G7U4_9PASS|nr:hypothetical protein HGM15179_013537 [Zosterops borbonicus]
MAEVLNAFFASVFSGKMACLQDNCPLGLVDGIKEQNGSPIIEKEVVRELLRCLDIHKSMGPDGIHPRVMRELADQLAKTLSIIYQQSWLTGEVPDDWKLVNVTPIHKKGEKKDPSNYRPLSLTLVLDVGGNLVTADEKMAEVLNAFFASVFSGKMACLQDNCPLGLVDGIKEQNGSPIIEKEVVRELLRCLDIHKSMGPDGIHPRVMRELADQLAKTLSIIYQQSWLTGEVPDDWKLVNVTPIHKKGEKKDPSNYRPLSLTLVLADSPGGCRMKAVDILYLDLNKAFDTVPHSTLLEKLAAQGLDRSSLLG